MTRPTRPKQKPPRGGNTEISDNERLSTSCSSLLSSPCPSRKDVEKENTRKRHYIQSPSTKESQNQRRRTLTPKPITASIPPSSLSPRYHLQKALNNLTQAYIGLKEEEEYRE